MSTSRTPPNNTPSHVNRYLYSSVYVIAMLLLAACGGSNNSSDKANEQTDSTDTALSVEGTEFVAETGEISFAERSFTLKIPDEWVAMHESMSNHIYLSAEALANSDQTSSIWQQRFGQYLDSHLDTGDFIAQFGNADWGNAAFRDTDIQARVYLLNRFEFDPHELIENIEQQITSTTGNELLFHLVNFRLDFDLTSTDWLNYSIIQRDVETAGTLEFNYHYLDDQVLLVVYMYPAVLIPQIDPHGDIMQSNLASARHNGQLVNEIPHYTPSGDCNRLYTPSWLAQDSAAIDFHFIGGPEYTVQHAIQDNNVAIYEAFKAFETKVGQHCTRRIGRISESDGWYLYFNNGMITEVENSTSQPQYFGRLYEFELLQPVVTLGYWDVTDSTTGAGEFVSLAEENINDPVVAETDSRIYVLRVQHGEDESFIY